MSRITALFNRYHQAYESNPPEGADPQALGDKNPRLKDIKLNEFRLLHENVSDSEFESKKVAFSQRGGNFMDRIVCWFEDNVLAHLPKSLNKTKRKANSDFQAHVNVALYEAGVPEAGREAFLSPVSGRKGRPLRVKRVRQVLQKVANVVNKEKLPPTAREAFGKYTEDHI